MEFSIDLKGDLRAGPDEPRGICIAAGSIVFTRLRRPNAAEEDNFVEAPPAQLAFWLVDNWWRLRWEGRHGRPTPGWRLAHDLSSIGGGYVWPRLFLWGVDSLLACQSYADPPGVVGPVRYLTDALCYPSAQSFEASVEKLLGAILNEESSISTDGPALRAQWSALAQERAEPEVAAWRRMEAKLGYDVDEAPAGLVEALGKLTDQFGVESVEEAAMAAPGEGALQVLHGAIDAAETSPVRCDFRPILELASTVERASEQPPWVSAEESARVLRETAAVDRGPLSNSGLGGLVGTSTKAFKQISGQTKSLPYGLRLGDVGANGVQHLSLRARRGPARRFEVARALGDAIWRRTSRLGPMGDADSARQRFQRAFAQALLCPFGDLNNYLGPGEITNDDISAAARHFQVSEPVVRTILLNKGRIDRERAEMGFDEGSTELAEATAA